MIGTYLSVLRRRWPLVALLTLLLAPLAWLGLTSSGGAYRSMAVIQRLDASVVEGVLGTSRGYQDPERLLATELEVLGSRVVAAATADELRSPDRPVTVEQVQAAVAFAPRGLSNYIEVVGSDPEPARAQELTTAFVSAYQQYKLGLQRDELERLDAELRNRLEVTEAELLELDAAGTDDTGAAARQRAAVLGRYESLSKLLEDIRLRLSVDTSGVEVLTEASEPVQEEGVLPSLPASVVALLAASAVACGLAVLLDLLRDPVRTWGEAQRLLPDVPILATLPRPGRPGSRTASLNDPRSAVMRAARLLHQRMAPEGHVVVTSTDGDGDVREYVGTAIAAAAARSSLREVLLVSLFADPSILPDAAGAGDDPLQTDVSGLWWRLPHVDGGAEPAQEADDGAVRFGLVVHVTEDAAAAGDAVAAASSPPLVLVVATLGSTAGRRLQQHAQDLERERAPASAMVLMDAARDRGRRHRGRQRGPQVGGPPADVPPRGGLGATAPIEAWAARAAEPAPPLATTGWPTDPPCQLGSGLEASSWDRTSSFGRD